MRGATDPRDPAGALTDLLLSLNMPDFAVPADPERRSAMLRSELASRRVLIILDDVASASQVAPLMPGTGASAVVVTSRNRLMDLAGADSMPLDTFDDGEASELLHRVAGAGRVDSKSAGRRGDPLGLREPAAGDPDRRFAAWRSGPI